MATGSSRESGSAYTHRWLNLIINVGGKVYRHILQNQLAYQKKSLRNFLEDNRTQISNDSNLSKDQYHVLFPVGRPAVDSCETFDITLIAYLLQTFFISEGKKLFVGDYR